MPEFERRGYIRYPVNGSINIKIEGDAQNIFRGDLIDASFSGLSVYLKEKLEIGTVVQFELMTDLIKKPLVGKGKIKNIKEVQKYDASAFRTSIEFIDVDILNLLNIVQSKISSEIKKRWRSKTLDFGPF